jgi:hypothetical protein
VVAAEYPKREQRRITLPYVLDNVHVEVWVGSGLLDLPRLQPQVKAAVALSRTP